MQALAPLPMKWSVPSSSRTDLVHWQTVSKACPDSASVPSADVTHKRCNEPAKLPLYWDQKERITFAGLDLAH
jgi:hypothetical protein